MVGWSSGSPAELDVLERHSLPSIARIAAQGNRVVAAMLPSGPSSTPAAFVSRHFFDTLGTTAVAGRLLTQADADPSSPPVAVISETMWRTAFNGAGDVLGRPIVIAGRGFTIVGVTPTGFPGLDNPDVGRRESDYPQVWLPMQFASIWKATAQPTVRFLAAAARLNDGATIAAARTELQIVAPRIRPITSERPHETTLRAFPAGLDPLDAPAEAALVVVLYLFVPLAILAIGCANVVNLHLARAVEKAGELSIRLALGATRGRIMRLLGVEIAVLAAVAGVLGWAGATLVLKSAQTLIPFRFALDGRALVFAVIVVTLAMLIAGGIPAWMAARDVIAPGLRARQRGPLHSGMLNLLVITQVAASVALLTLSLLALRTLQVHAPAASADARSTLVAELNLANANPDNPKAAMFVRSVLDRLAFEPSVRSAGLADFFIHGNSIPYSLPSDGDGVQRTARGGVVTPGWFDATEMTFLAGRAPQTSGAQVFEVAVNDTLASALAGTRASALGSQLRVRYVGDRVLEVVGIIADTVFESDGRPVPMMILPMPEVPPSYLFLTVRTTDIEAARQATRTAVAAFDPSLPFIRLESLETRLSEEFRAFRAMTFFTVTLAATGLLLSAAGLYALLAYSVRRRTYEIGVRVAVGASPRDVFALVVRLGLSLVTVGGVLGILIATPVAWLMESVLFGLSALSPWAALPAIALLLLVSGIATAIPVYRALHIDPLSALRES